MSVCQLSRGTDFQRAMLKALPPSSPTPHGTLFGLNDGDEMVGPSRAEAVSGGVVKLCRALRGDEEDLAQWVARDADG